MGNSRGIVLQYLLFFAVCLVFYGNTIPNDYAYDDSVVITENRFTQRGFAGIYEIFTNNTFRGSYDNAPTVQRYRPLSVATFAVELQLFGPNPHVSHFDNILLLSLTALLLYKFTSKLFKRQSAREGLVDLPLFAALLFIAHPVHTETVANIKGRDDILALAGCLSATLAVLRYLDTREYRHLVWSSILFLLALLAKENAITFVAIIPLTTYYYKGEQWRTVVRPLWPLLAVSAVFLLAMRWAVGRPESGSHLAVDIITDPFAYATTSERFATAIYTCGRYLGLLVFPHPLTIDYNPYHIRLVNWNSVTVWFSILAYTLMAVYALRNLSRRSAFSYGALFYVCTFSIVSNLPFSIGTFMSERFMFMPSVGFVIVVAWLVSTRVRVTRYKYLALLALLLPSLSKTYNRNQTWKNDFTLFTTDVKTSSNSIKANLAAAVTFLEESQKSEDRASFETYRASALEHAKKAVSIFETSVDTRHLKGPSYSHAIMLMGDCYAANDKLADALQTYKRILHSVPNRDQLYDTIEATIGKSSDVDFKLKSYSEFVDLVPDGFLFNYRLGYLYGKEKSDLAKSVLYLERAVDLRSDEPHALEALSHAYKLSKDYEKAAFYLERALTSNPTDSAILTRLQDIYKIAGNTDKAREMADRLELLQGPQLW